MRITHSLCLIIIILSLTACVTTSKQVHSEKIVENSTEKTEHAPVISSQADILSIQDDEPDQNPLYLHNIPESPSDSAMPWWAVVANWEAEQTDEVKFFVSREDNKQVIHEETTSYQDESDAFADDSGEFSPFPEVQADLWDRIRSGFRLAGQDHRFVKPYIDWYARHQSYLDRVVERARPFLYEIVEEIEARDMPMEIALLPVVESAFQPFAYSPGRAAGIWQFIPGTGKLYGLKQNWWYDGRRDVAKSTKAALKYLERLQKRFDGDWLLALASYNTGEGRVARAVKKNLKKDKPTDFWSLDLPDETQGYVPKLLAISAIIQDTESFGLTLESIPDEPYLEPVNIGSQIDLALAAELAGLSIEEMYRLNPAFNRWATDPDGPHQLLLPIDKAEGFREALATVDKKKRIQWKRHRIRQGETLGHISKKYQTTVTLLQDVNNIRDKWIRAGDSIVIPVATKNLQHYLSQDQRRLALQSTERRGIKIKHTVRPGDTFWDLSRKFKVKVGQLARWNGMSPKDSLMPGQKLVVWAKNRNVSNARYVTPPHSATRQQLHYTVRKGDSLARIAQKFSVTVTKLRRWNSLPKNKYLQPGQMLTLYVDVTQQS